MAVKSKPFLLYPDVGLLLLRLAVGGLMLFHGIDKLIHGIAPYKDLLMKKGLPALLAYGIPLGEVVAPILIVVGLWTRVSSLLIVFTMLMSVYLAFGMEAFTLNQFGGLTIELNLLYLFGALCLFFTGPGTISVSKGIGKWD